MFDCVFTIFTDDGVENDVGGTADEAVVEMDADRIVVIVLMMLALRLMLM